MNEKRQSIDGNNEMTEIIELSDKDYKKAIIKMIEEAIKNM